MTQEHVDFLEPYFRQWLTDNGHDPDKLYDEEEDRLYSKFYDEFYKDKQVKGWKI